MSLKHNATLKSRILVYFIAFLYKVKERIINVQKSISIVYCAYKCGESGGLKYFVFLYFGCTVITGYKLLVFSCTYACYAFYREPKAGLITVDKILQCRLLHCEPCSWQLEEIVFQCHFILLSFRTTNQRIPSSHVDWCCVKAWKKKVSFDIFFKIMVGLL